MGAGVGTISIWKIGDNSLQLHRAIDTPSNGFNRVRLRSDCKLLVTCGWDKAIRLHTPKKGTLLALMDFHRGSVNAVAFNNDFSFVTSSKDSALCRWNLYSKNTS